MNRPLRLLASLATTLALAFGIAFAVVRAQAEPPRAAAVALARSDADLGAAPAGSDYDLSKLPVLRQTILFIDRNYVDPRRIDPKAMVLGALDGVEKTVAEVLVQGSAAEGKLTLTVGSARRTFDISGVNNLFDVSAVLGDMMAFVQKNLVAQKNLRDIEYAAVNGMLATLDPHSVLLDPRAYRDMKVATRGEFGGLGFVISMRDGYLTVLRVLKGTPAYRAGIKAKDVISRIEDQSTINMDVQDAVERLRGRPSTRVTIAVQRAGWPEPHRLTLVRELISVDTIPQAKLLEHGIGYVKISQFNGNTTRDLLAALQRERTQAGGTLRGLVMDLRSNPGGLLDQAVQVSDLFLSSGVIVKTVGGDRVELREAHADRDDMTALPLVVLVNNSSASASEIVAGALKNDNRALIVGRQTFGKGSVQVLHDFPVPGKPGDELAVKLTIAEYLTPGDISIQEVGITPDVLLLPGRILKGAVNYFAPARTMGEVDLQRHLSNPNDRLLSPQEAARRTAERAARVEKAPLELRYLLDEKQDQVAKAMKAGERGGAAALSHADADISPEQQEDEEVEANPDEVVEDYPIRFARELLDRHPYADRPRLLEAAQLLVSELRGEEDARVARRIEALGVDWAPGPAGQGTPLATVTVSPSPGKRFVAGETVPWTVTVENKGTAAFHQLRAWSSVRKNALLDRREFLFGTVAPGQKRSWTVPVKLPRALDSRHDDPKIHFEEENGRAPPDVATSFDVLEAPKPVFAFSTQLDDEQGGNGDGQAQRGEEIAVRIDVKNTGDGPSGDRTYVSLKNLGDEKIFIQKGRAVIGALKPGEVKSAVLQLVVRKGLKASTMPLRVLVADEQLDEYVSEKVELPVKPDGAAKSRASGDVRVTAPELFVRAGAGLDAPPIALAKRGEVLPVQARFGSALRVEWQKGRFGFLSEAEVAKVRARRAASLPEVWQHDPPRIAIAPDPSKGAPIVDGEKMHIQGDAVVSSAVPGAHLRDLFVFVNDEKVFFRLAPDRAATRIDFATDLPLKPGNNLITVFAQEDDEFQSRRSFVAYRRVSEVAAQAPR